MPFLTPISSLEHKKFYMSNNQQYDVTLFVGCLQINKHEAVAETRAKK